MRRFNNIFGDTFPEPEAELTSAPMVLGFDNRKMSKSYGNAVDMAATPEETFQAIRTAITDPQRVRRDDRAAQKSATSIHFMDSSVRRNSCRSPQTAAAPRLVASTARRC